MVRMVRRYLKESGRKKFSMYEIQAVLQYLAFRGQWIVFRSKLDNARMPSFPIGFGSKWSDLGDLCRTKRFTIPLLYSDAKTDNHKGKLEEILCLSRSMLESLSITPGYWSRLLRVLTRLLRLTTC